MWTRLSTLLPGRYAIIQKVEGDDALSCRLLALGFVRGTELYCERLSPFGDPMLLRLSGFRVMLRRAEAARVLIEMGEKHENHSISWKSKLRQIRIIQPSDRQ